MGIKGLISAGYRQITPINTKIEGEAEVLDFVLLTQKFIRPFCEICDICG